MKNFQVAIVGGGASGLLCAIELILGTDKLKGEDIAIIERNDRVGKKLVATGNGRGNLSNCKISSNYYHGNEDFINSFIKNISNNEICEYLENLGINLTKEDNKIYPLSFQANSVLDILRAILIKNKVNIVTSTKINNIYKNCNNFILQSESQNFTAKNVVLAVGGTCGKQFGTDGSSYILAKNFGHAVTKLFPSLVQLKTNTYNIKGLKGIKEVAKVNAFNNDKFLVSSIGDVLFTDYGVSGSAIFNVSGYLSNVNNPKIEIEFLPNIDKNDICDIINFRLKKDYFNDCGILTGLINKKLGEKIIKDLTLKLNRFPNSMEIANQIKRFSLNVLGTLGYDYAQVTKGGIETSKINSNSFESKLINNLYIVGEMLNVDGDCGGYNLTFAFYSGISSAKSIKNKNKI